MDVQYYFKYRIFTFSACSSRAGWETNWFEFLKLTNKFNFVNFYRSTEFNKYLLDLPNFFIFHAKLEDLMKGTCVGHVFEDLQRSNFPVEHAADITRLLMVYKYGGAYLDLDFVSIK